MASEGVSVTIIIPTYNAPELLRKCLSALERNTIAPYDLLIIDDRSPEVEMHEYLHELEYKHRVIMLRTRLGFAGINNRAVSETDTKYICLLNSDTEPGYKWLSYMLVELDDYEDVGVVGAKLMYPPQKGFNLGGKIQHAGVATTPEGYPYHIHVGQPSDFPQANVRRELNAVTGACMLIRRKMWDELKGFDETYVGGEFEDIDFSWRAREAGWKIIYQPKAELLHFEHGSGEEWVQLTSATNCDRLRERWRGKGSDEHLFV